MSIRNILIHPDPRLKKTVDPVADVNDDLRRLADDMLETMYDAPGIGLAAPQVAVMARMLVMDCAKEDAATPEPMVLINPSVIWSSDELSVYDEGCLSIPDQYAEVERPASVKVKCPRHPLGQWCRAPSTGLGGARAMPHRRPRTRQVHSFRPKPWPRLLGRILRQR